MDKIINVFNLIPTWLLNFMAIIGFIASLVTLKNHLPKICLFKQRKVYNELIIRLKNDTHKYWHSNSPNIKYGKALIKTFKDLNTFISNNKFKYSPSDYRSSLYDIFTMDMEDNNIYKCKQATIKKNYNTLIDELGKYKKYIQ